MLDMKNQKFPPTKAWLRLWTKLDSAKRHDSARRIGIDYNLMRGYANGTKRMGPDRARKAAKALNDMGYHLVHKGWFRPDLWES